LFDFLSSRQRAQDHISYIFHRFVAWIRIYFCQELSSSFLFLHSNL
jgi:hypothetical protein